MPIRIGEEIERFTAQPQPVLEDVDRFRHRLENELREVIREAERGVENTPDIEFYLVRSPADSEVDIDPDRFLISLSVAMFAAGNSDPSIFDLFENTGEQRVGRAALGLYSERNDLVTSTALYMPGDSDYIAFSKIPSGMMPESGSIPPILASLWNFLSSGISGQELEAKVNHELTHAYIQRNVPNARQSEETQAINEAAAQVVDYLGSGSMDPSEEYQREGISKEYFHTAQWYFQTIAEQRERPGAITLIRERAVEAIQRLNQRPNIDILEALDPDDYRELRKLRSVLFLVERVENHVFNALVKLGVVPEEEARNFLKHLEEDLENQYIIGYNNLFPEDMMPSQLGESVAEEGRQPGSLDDLTDEGGLRANDFMKQMVEGTRDLNRILEQEALDWREEKEMKQLLNNLGGVIRQYREDDKLESYLDRIGEEKKHADRMLAKFTDSNTTSSAALKSSERTLEKELKQLLEVYRRIVETGIDYNQKIIDGLETLHGEESRAAEIAREYKDREGYEELKVMHEVTEEILELCEHTQKELEEALKVLDEAERKAESPVRK